MQTKKRAKPVKFGKPKAEPPKINVPQVENNDDQKSEHDIEIKTTSAAQVTNDGHESSEVKVSHAQIHESTSKAHESKMPDEEPIAHAESKPHHSELTSDEIASKAREIETRVLNKHHESKKDHPATHESSVDTASREEYPQEPPSPPVHKASHSQHTQPIQFVRDRDIIEASHSREESENDAIPPSQSEEIRGPEPTREEIMLPEEKENPVLPKQEEDVREAEKDEMDEKKSSSDGQDAFVVEKEVKKNMIGYFMLIAILSFIVGLLSMAVANFYLQGDQESSSLPFAAASPTSTPKPKPTKAPTSTPEEVDPSEYRIRILNGSGVTGAAGRLRQALSEEGYDVVSVGNADRSDYEETVITPGEDVKSQFVKDLKKQVGDLYELDASNKDTLSSTSEADLVIIIGSKTTEN